MVRSALAGIWRVATVKTEHRRDRGGLIGCLYYGLVKTVNKIYEA